MTRDNLKKAGVGALIDKIFGEVIEKLQEMQLDRAEWGCLRAVMLFSPGLEHLLVNTPIPKKITSIFR